MKDRHKVGESFGIRRSTVYNIIRAKNKIKKIIAQGVSPIGANVPKTMKRPTLVELDDILYTWSKARCAEGKIIFSKMILGKRLSNSVMKKHSQVMK